jgi:hypothetical protein
MDYNTAMQTETPTLQKFVIKTTRPKTPVGYKKYPKDRGKYLNSILGKEIESEQIVWAERRIDHGALFEGDKIYYRLYTFVKE